MNDQMPMFDDPIPTEQPPKKPRQKPTRRKRGRPAVKVAPKPVKKRRKRRTVAPVAKVPRLAVMFDACARISDVLRNLTPKERSAVLESVGHVA